MVKKKVGPLPVAEKREMIEPEHKVISIQRQCEMAGLASSSFYFQPKGLSEKSLALMREIDEIYTKWPFFGSRKIREILRKKGHLVNRKQVQRLMQAMGIQAIYRGKRTTIPDVAHKKYPYLLRDLVIERTNQVWCADITYIPMSRGWVYLVAIMDWHSRCVLSWRLSNSMDVNFCLEALAEALAKHGKPEIFNTDQGSQFTSEAFTGILLKHNIRISMDGRGRALDNVFIERLWRSLKYEDVYLHAYASVRDAHERIRKWMDFYNTERPHEGLGYQTPDAVYFGRKHVAC